MPGSNVSEKKIELMEDIISVEDVEIVVKKALGPKAIIIDYEIKMFSKEKVGFLGDHRYLEVTTRMGTSNELKMYSFFVKFVPYNNEALALVIEDTNAFYKEAMFYKLIAPELLRGIKDKSWYAQCYLIKDDILIFENLKSKNYLNKPKVLDITALKSALIALAKLHAASIVAENRLGKTLKEVYPVVFEECLFVREGNKFSEWFRIGVDVCVAIAKYLDLDATVVPKVMNRIFDAITLSKIRRNVVCHGDAWSFNLMFDDSQPLPKCVLVDFQLVRYAPMMTDVAQLLYLTTRREFRDKNSKNLLAHYHNTLCEALRDSKEVIPPTFDEIVQDYEALKLVGLITAASYLPINLIEPKLCAEMTKDSKGYTQLLFRDRVDVVMDFMKDPNYRERNCEIIKEMLEKHEEFLSVQL